MWKRTGRSSRGCSNGWRPLELLKGRTVAIDSTTLEANAAMRSIVRRDTGETYQEFLTRLATESGIKTPTREALAQLDRRRQKRTSNQDWKNPFDPDAKVTKMKDGRTHLAHKAEHAIDLDSGAMVAVTVQGADVGDTTSLVETASAAADQVEAATAANATPAALTELHCGQGVSQQPDAGRSARGRRAVVHRGARPWAPPLDECARRSARGLRQSATPPRAAGQAAHARRGEYVERSFAHVYDTGGMRRTHLRGHPNILKRLLIHASAFNLGILMRQVFGPARPGVQGDSLGPARSKSPSPCSASGSGDGQRASGARETPPAPIEPSFGARDCLMARAAFTTDC